MKVDRMKRTIAVVALILALSITVKTQPITVISFGPTVTILDTTSAGSVTGSTFALPGGNANVFTWTVVPVGGPSAISVTLQASTDNSTWFTLSTCTTAAGCIYNSGVNAYKFVRSVQNSRTGGTSTTASVNTARAYSIGSGRSPLMSGTLLFDPDNTYDIGAQVTNRPRNLYVGTAIVAGSTITGAHLTASAGGAISWSSRSRLWSAADGQILLSNAASTDFGMLQFGGTTNLFPAIARSGTQIQLLLADGSAHAMLRAAGIQFSAMGTISASSDGSFMLRNAAGADFSMLQFGGTTSAFPALKRSTTSLQVRLADDSGSGGFNAGMIGLGVATPTAAGLIALGPTLFASLSTPVNGTIAYCSDCTITPVCAGSGTGAFAKRLNGVWVCN